MNISFTEKQEKYIQSQLKSGDFQNASEVVLDALRLHEVTEAVTYLKTSNSTSCP